MQSSVFRFRATTIAAVAAATLALTASVGLPSAAHASIDEPWPEPPSCSNETGTCTSMEDLVAYECYFENPDSPFHFCDDPLEFSKGDIGLVAPKSAPAPGKIVLPAPRR